MKIGDKVSVLGGTQEGIITEINTAGIPGMYSVTSENKFPNEYVWDSYVGLFFESDMEKVE